MSGDESQDVELRELVAQTLEKNGVLPKIRAQLRASVFLTLEDQELSKCPLINQPLKDYVSTSEGSLVLSLIRELLEFYELENTLAVFDPETNYGKDYNYLDRNQILRDLKLSNVNGRKGPLLGHIVQLIQQDFISQDKFHSSATDHPFSNSNKKVTDANEVMPNEVQNKPAFTNGAINLSESHPLNNLPSSGSLLGSLPPLTGANLSKAPGKQEKGQDLNKLESDLLNLGLDSLENYDEDFQSSASESPREESSKSNRSEIEEEVSVGDESIDEKSAQDDNVTVDTAVTSSNLSNVADYVEDL